MLDWVCSRSYKQGCTGRHDTRRPAHRRDVIVAPPTRTTDDAFNGIAIAKHVIKYLSFVKIFAYIPTLLKAIFGKRNIRRIQKCDIFAKN